MQKLALPCALVALLATASLATAATVVGTIKTIDAAKSMLMLDNGTSYMVPANAKVNLSTLKVGEKVDVTYSEMGGKMEISTIKPAA